MVEEYNKLSESQAGFRFGCSCVDNLFVLNEVIQDRLQKVRKHFLFKETDTVWRDDLWYRMWEMGNNEIRHGL